MTDIRVAIAGLGNCAAALIQGVEYYKNAPDDEFVPGLMHVRLGPYHVGDVKFVAAFDVSRNKIGKELTEAMFEKPNITKKFKDVPKTDVIVKPGPVLDGVAEHMKEYFCPHEQKVTLDDVVGELKNARAHVLVNFLPVGSKEATRFYAEAAIKAGVAFVNGIPEFIASDPEGIWQKKFENAGVPVVGDDIKGQIGATIFHRTLVRLLHLRSVIVEETYQLNVGGNTDFLNMKREERLSSKRISKTSAVTSVLPYGDTLYKEGRVRIGPSDYVPALGNTKVAYFYILGRSFAGFPVRIHAKLEVDDKSMFAGAMIDAIRATKIALDRRIGGPIISASAHFFKHPPVQAPDEETARAWLEDFIAGKRER
ncbi:MAG: inositol-3-phosphate synthase [Candidatus Korarchaeota archaeon]